MAELYFENPLSAHRRTELHDRARLELDADQRVRLASVHRVNPLRQLREESNTDGAGAATTIKWADDHGSALDDAESGEDDGDGQQEDGEAYPDSDLEYERDGAESAHILFQGLLTKSPPLDNPNQKTKKKWRKRYFVLYSMRPESGFLEYYYNQFCFDSGDNPLGRIDLVEARTVQAVAGHPKYRFLLRLQTDHRNFYLAADSEAAFREWRTHLHHELTFLTESDSDGPHQPPDSAAPAPAAAARGVPQGAFGQSDRETAHLFQPWFYGPIPREKATEELHRITKGSREGVFLVRESGQPGNFALSAVKQGQVIHLKILSVSEGLVLQRDNHPGPMRTLSDLIESPKLSYCLGPFRPVEWADRLDAPPHAAVGPSAPAPGPRTGNAVPSAVISAQPRPTASPDTMHEHARIMELDRMVNARKFHVEQQFEFKTFEVGPEIRHVLRYVASTGQEEIHLPRFQQDWEGANMYYVKDQTGNFLFAISEKAHSKIRQRCCGEHRPFEYGMFGASVSGPVFRAERSFAQCCACCPGCYPKVHVYLRDDLIGTVVQPMFGGFFQPTYKIRDNTGATVLKIKGPFRVKPKGVSTFHILAPTGGSYWEQVGHIKRKQRSMRFEQATDADNFSLSFPETLPLEQKASLLAAQLLIDHVHFEGRSSAASYAHMWLPKNEGADMVRVDLDTPSGGPCRIGCCDLYCCGHICRC